jgi:Golgi phosphoprotein 3
MLSMLEEVVLLAVDEETGDLRSTREHGTAYALVGALFFDLALARKIDTDTEKIHVIDTTPTGDPILDRILADLAGRTNLRTVRDWIEEIYLRRRDLEGEALESLMARGILRHERSKRLWLIDVERFPLVNSRPQQHVRLRLAEAIRNDRIPDTRDIMLVSLARQCGLLGFVLSEAELEHRSGWIERLCGVETISRKVSEAIVNLDSSLKRAMARVV